jgi:hypothetical protein
MKKYLCALLAVLLCFLPYSTSFASGSTTKVPTTISNNSTPAASSDYSVTFIPEYEFTIVSTELNNTNNIEPENIEWNDTDSSINSLPEKEVTASFSHKIYDRNKKLMATATSTVKGVYSSVDRWSEITSVSAKFSGEYKNDFSYSSSTDGNKGYLYIEFNGVTLNTQTYTISTNGKITNN